MVNLPKTCHLLLWWSGCWWYTYPSEKSWTSSVGSMKFPTKNGKSWKIPWFQTTNQSGNLPTMENHKSQLGFLFPIPIYGKNMFQTTKQLISYICSIAPKKNARIFHRIHPLGRRHSTPSCSRLLSYQDRPAPLVVHQPQGPQGQLARRAAVEMVGKKRSQRGGKIVVFSTLNHEKLGFTCEKW